MNSPPIASVFAVAALSLSGALALAAPAHADGAPWVDTAAAVTENLSAQGGTAIFSRLRTDQINLVLLMEDTTSAMSAFFGEALAGDALANATSNIQGLGRHIDGYLAAPGSEHLSQASDALLLAMNNLQDAGLQAMGAYTIAAGLRLSVLQEQAAAGMTGAADALRGEAAVFSDRIDAWVVQYTLITEEVFEAIQCAGLPVDPGGPERAVADAMGPAIDAAAGWRVLATN
ncbi:MAG: hypothetical protein HOB82_07020 [Alphaproteobacteria bacterium]|jgi:hypothetical protein|nr:hypothetical protein [Alphaproteobacteria bacterium]